MSSASDTAIPLPLRPSVFISYASEDRAAARLLRDALAAAGLEVWYDESELGGGDAWDQKIRRQIRDCDYFMPIISVATEARKEGYFRREWRLAVERTMDMADDVLFLLPVSIDDTSEVGARVPDKFLHVQWLRFPGGRPTPALDSVIRRILAGDNHALTRPPMPMARPPTPVVAPTTPPLLSETGTPRREPPPIPPMPPFPAVPEKGGFGHGVKFVAEVLWWTLSAGWLLLNRLPRWMRFLVIAWLVISFLSRCGSGNVTVGNRERSQPTAAEKAEAEKAIKATVEKFVQAAGANHPNGKSADLANFGAQLARDLAIGLKDVDAGGKTLVLIPFAPPTADDPAAKFARAIFTSLYGRLVLAHPDEVGASAEPLPAATDDALVARGKKLGSEFVVAAALNGAGDQRELNVRLLGVDDGRVKWTGSFPTGGADPTTVAEKIADGVLAAWPKK